MGRLVNTDDVIKHLCPFYSECDGKDRCETVTYCSFYNKLKEIPTASDTNKAIANTIDIIKECGLKGIWTHVCAEGACYYTCSVCGGNSIIEREECPKCHSKMKVGET